MTPSLSCVSSTVYLKFLRLAGKTVVASRHSELTSGGFWVGSDTGVSDAITPSQ